MAVCGIHNGLEAQLMRVEVKRIRLIDDVHGVASSVDLLPSGRKQALARGSDQGGENSEALREKLQMV